MKRSICGLFVLSLVLISSVLTAPSLLRAETLDQSNNPAWTGGAVNIAPANTVSQSFVPSLPVLTGVTVALKTGNKGKGGDQVTLKIFNAGGQQLASSTATLNEGFDAFWRFTLPGGGISVTPGQPLTMRLQDTGKSVFWWKYKGGNLYPAGKAMFHGSEFSDNDFYFMTYGANAAQSFSLTVTPDPVNITKGGSQQVTIAVTRQNGFAKPVEVSFPTLPQGVSASPATKNISGGSGVFTLAAGSAAAAGQYTARVKGFTDAVGVQTPPPKDFQIKISAPVTPACAQGLTSCGSLCVDTKSDISNCGACGRTCSANQKCSGGTCVIQCGGQTCASGDWCCQGACRKSVDGGSCPYQGSAQEYYCPELTKPCPKVYSDSMSTCCCGVYDGIIKSCPGPGK